MSQYPKLTIRLEDENMEVRIRQGLNGYHEASLDGYGHSGEELGQLGFGVSIEHALEHLERRLA